MVAVVTRMAHDGTVVIPEILRNKLNLRAGEPLIVVEVEGRIVFSSARGESVRSEFNTLVDEIDRRFANADHGIDPVELVRQLRETRMDF